MDSSVCPSCRDSHQAVYTLTLDDPDRVCKNGEKKGLWMDRIKCYASRDYVTGRDIVFINFFYLF